LKGDEATRAVAKSLVGDLGYYLEQYQQFMEQQRESTRQATDAIHDEFYPKKKYGGYNIIELGGNRTEREKQEDAFLSYLLIDPVRYE